MGRKPYIKKPKATEKIRYKHTNPCIVCRKKLRQKTTLERNLVNLSSKIKVSVQVSRCVNESCSHHNLSVKPAHYVMQTVPNSGYGIDVYGLVGKYRWGDRKTVLEIHQDILKNYPHVLISERHVENIVNDLELYIQGSYKNVVSSN